MHVTNTIRFFLSTNLNSNDLRTCFVQSSLCREAVIHSTNTCLDFLEHLSTPDCAVAQVRLAGLSYLFVSAYFDGNRDIEIDLDHFDTIIGSVPGGRVLMHADVNSRDEL